MTPLDAQEPVLWLDAADIHDTQDGAVLRWPDRSGHGFDAVFRPFVVNWATGARTFHQPPLLLNGALNDLPVVSFNALYGHTLILSEAGGAIDRNAEGFTILFVYRSRLIQPQGGNKYLFISHNRENHAGEKPEAGNTRFALMRNGSTGGMRMHARRTKLGASEIWDVESGAGQLGDMEWGLATWAVDYAGSHASVRYSGREVASYEMPGEGPTEDYDSPVIAIASTSEGNYLTCDIAEIICYRRALGGAELAQLETDLMAKYGLVPAAS